ncbi:Low affinity copper transporter [Penicillium canariense]|uniref:Copper transport protein n=1 Tax=Penicillium canariense TaxID=189055 RepID=A0A9W9IJX6_9EURO|nr:Low affinity copper transporter [Penicillium canariense]KAJ5175661.1 Low affinity copper transporter [Penicillium canariense]
MMDMSDMTATTSTTAASTMAMAMSTSTSTSSSMDMSSSSMTMSMADMAMTFFTSFKTPLYSNEWTPSSQGQYAGTCIFLIVLAVLLRILLALRPILEGRVWTDSVQHSMLGEHLPDASHKTKPVPGLQLSIQELGSRWSRWRVNPAAGRATYELVVSGIAYLLMLAVMTMNVGYFMSVLGGIWLGTFIMGGVASQSSMLHC